MALRHRPHEMGLNMSQGGTVDIDELSAASPGFQVWEMKDVVQYSKKCRFDLVNNKVRAVNGHSVNLTGILNSRDFMTKVSSKNAHELPYVLLHGSEGNCAKRIWEQGISPMSRETIHLTSEISKIKPSSDIIIEIRTSDLMDSKDITLYMTKNKLFVTYEPIPSSLFHRILKKNPCGNWEVFVDRQRQPQPPPKHYMTATFDGTSYGSECLVASEGALILPLSSKDEHGWMFGILHSSGQRGWYPLEWVHVE